MRIYRVISGDMDVVVEVPYKAEPIDIFKRAIVNVAERVLLGLIAEISGEQFGEPGGDEAAYISTERCLKEMGWME